MISFRNSTNKYFDKESGNYNKNKSRGLWGLLVRKEISAIKSALNLEKRDLILDAGCGAGFYSKLIVSENANVFGIDVSHKMIKEYKRNGFKGAVANIENFNLNKQFDKILCAGAIEFCNNPELVIKNLAKHLKKDGSIVILYPNKGLFGLFYKLFHKIHNISVCLFSRKQFRHILEKNGFEFIDDKKITIISSFIKAKKR